MDIEIIGYFIDPDGTINNPADVFVAIDDTPNYNRITYYCPIGQHSEGLRGYLDDCKEISKEEYIGATKNFYTPYEYLL